MLLLLLTINNTQQKNMGQSNTKAPRTLESYTSFDVLPTEFFNRRTLENQYNAQYQQQYNQQMTPQYNQPQAQQYYTPSPANNHQQYQLQFGQPPLIQAFGQRPPQHQPHVSHIQPNQNSFSDLRHAEAFANHFTSHSEQSRAINPSYNSLSSRKHLGLAPSTSQPIQSVPKFNKSGPLNHY